MADLDGEVMRCANHPDTETLLRCNRCGKPICTRCAVRTPVGFRCKQCVRALQSVYFTARASDFLIAGGVVFALSVVAGGLVPFLVRLIPFYAWLAMILVAPAVAGIVAEAARRSIGRRRGRHLEWVACGAAVAGSGIGFFLLWLFVAFVDWLLLLIYVILLASTIYARMR